MGVITIGTLPRVSDCICQLQIGLFQMGDGTLIALWTAVFANKLWTAVFANKSETNKMWEFCADHIRIAGYLYYAYACVN
jgi:hypothetical protein